VFCVGDGEAGGAEGKTGGGVHVTTDLPGDV
jgi:hypothetical protein